MIFFICRLPKGISCREKRESIATGGGKRLLREMLILSSVEVRSKLCMCVRKLNSGKDNTYLPCTQLQLHSKNITRQFLLSVYFIIPL